MALTAATEIGSGGGGGGGGGFGGGGAAAGAQDIGRATLVTTLVQRQWTKYPVIGRAGARLLREACANNPDITFQELVLVRNQMGKFVLDARMVLQHWPEIAGAHTPYLYVPIECYVFDQYI